jgi:predicted O-linked N-acetylglucosamine transferase (SPINDLY family)
MSPYCILFHTDDPLLHLARGFAFHKRKIGRPVLSFHAQHLARRKAPRKSGRIRIGYLSSYLREHAHGYLTAEMYRLHDRDKVEVFAYSCSGRTLDRIQTRIMDGVDHWIDIDDLTDEQSARRIFDDQIDILVDFNGYTGDARVKIMSMRPAPIIVNWLGYPATTGTPYHDYIIADDFIIPTGYEKYYSEKVLRLPCYQPNDRLRLVADRQWTRAAAGLPERGVVFCAFNGIQKVTAFMWRRYMAILDQVPGSALWLLEGKETTNQRLRAMAEAQGIAGERIVFAPPLVNAEHLARFAMADLFLDTSPYGAHTTASDALWMGVPVLTAPGRSFAARVCGSLVAAAGIGELICDSLDDYVGKAVQLGRDRDRLAALRKKIIDNRDTCDLFNTKKLVSHLDDIFLQMWSEYSRGKTPRPDLSNLEIYDEIGTELDRDEVEMQSVADYESLYLQRLRERDDYFPINPDKRLWQRKK